MDPNGSFNLARGVFTSTHTSKMEEVPPVKNPAESSRKKSQIIKNAGKQLKNFELFSIKINNQKAENASQNSYNMMKKTNSMIFTSKGINWTDKAQSPQKRLQSADRSSKPHIPQNMLHNMYIFQKQQSRSARKQNLSQSASHRQTGSHHKLKNEIQKINSDLDMDNFNQTNERH